ncbi:MAG: 16S rRNA (cytidine(1402)-2'-O)-methyltransferase [Anaerolineae bacterium]|nr:16S rRNA (cytidine(1402)-2'-O)-methyltransferase [Anaerolineae bacterium]
MGTLYLVPTPIGNLEDITIRAVRILGEVALIAAEDTRTSRILLDHYDISTPLTSYHEHNKLTKLDSILSTLADGDVALISDAGTPAISDPGYELVKAVIQAGYRVEALPGANAVLPALTASGLPTDTFLFLGFFPRKTGDQVALLTDIATLKHTLIFYESPNRLVDTLGMIHQVLGNRAVAVAREISKKFEEFLRGDVEMVVAHFQTHSPRGEIVIVVGGAGDDAPRKWSESQLRDEIAKRRADGDSMKSIAHDLAEISGWHKRDIYALGVHE